MSSELLVEPDADSVARHAAELTLALARDAVAERGRFVIALSGGSTPEKLYRLLAEMPYRETFPWDETFVFMGDERLVPDTDERSNFGMARRTLLDRVTIPRWNCYAVPAELPTAAEAAHRYAEELRRYFGVDETIVFDLVLLGLGDDGHTASLFPGKPALHITDTPVTYSEPGVLPPPVDRVTFTFPVINGARTVLFLVTGEKKREKLALVRSGTASVEDTPAAGVAPTNGRLIFLVDAAASGGSGT